MNKSFTKTLKLNQAQEVAVLNSNRMVAVLAGPGTGKTTTCVAKLIDLVLNQNVDARNILLITFSNHAVAELKSRLKHFTKILNLDYDLLFKNVNIYTYHSFCYYLLNVSFKSLKNFPYLPNFVVADEADSKKIIKELLVRIAAETDSNLDLYVDPAKIPLNKIVNLVFYHSIKRKVSYDIAPPIAIEYYLPLLAKIFNVKNMAGLEDELDKYADLYAEELKKYNLVDFVDLLNYVYTELKTNKTLREIWQKKWKAIILDELQDTNQVQYDIIKQLVVNSTILFFVGDPNQCIYEFRGSKPNIFSAIKQDFDSKTNGEVNFIQLVKNYRSHQEILDTIHEVILSNYKKPKAKKSSHIYPDKLVSELSSQGPKIELYEEKDMNAEANAIVKIIRKNKLKSDRYSDFAILTRYNQQLIPFKEKLLNRKIPYLDYNSQVKFTKLPETTPLIFFLRMILVKDNLSVLESIENPHRGIGPKSRDLLIAAAAAENLTLYDFLMTDELLEKHFKKSLLSKLLEFKNLISNLEYLFEKCVVARNDLIKWFTSLQKHLRYQEYYLPLIQRTKNKNNPDFALKMIKSNIDAFYEGFKEYQLEQEQKSEDLNPTEIAKNFILTIFTAKHGTKSNQKDGVKLMSIHKSKGLEFKYVIIPGLSEGSFPRFYDKENWASELRVLYVAMSRSQKKCILLRYENKITPNSNGNFSYRPYEISSFIKPIFHKLDIYSGGKFLGSGSNDKNSTSQLRGFDVKNAKKSNDNVIAGNKIYHNKYKLGQVITVNLGDETIIAQFSDCIKELEIESEHWYVL